MDQHALLAWLQVSSSANMKVLQSLLIKDSISLVNIDTLAPNTLSHKVWKDIAVLLIAIVIRSKMNEFVGGSTCFAPQLIDNKVKKVFVLCCVMKEFHWWPTIHSFLRFTFRSTQWLSVRTSMFYGRSPACKFPSAFFVSLMPPLLTQWFRSMWSWSMSCGFQISSYTTSRPSRYVPIF